MMQSHSRRLILSIKEGDVIVTPMPQATGVWRRRPVVVLREMRPFGDFLVCGISTQLRHEVKNFYEIISDAHHDFASSGLAADSLIRLGFLSILPHGFVAGSIGSISPERHRRLLERLSNYLVTQ